MINLTGKWMGNLSGTNAGEFVLDLDHTAGRIYGTGQFCEPGLGGYKYTVQGLTQEDRFAIDLTPHQKVGWNCIHFLSCPSTTKKETAQKSSKRAQKHRSFTA